MAALDPTITLGALLVAVPATISAIASLRGNRAIRTNSGRRPGEYIELIAQRQELMDVKMQNHIHDDEQAFERIEETLKTQDAASIQVRSALLEDAAEVKIEPQRAWTEDHPNETDPS